MMSFEEMAAAKFATVELVSEVSTPVNPQYAPLGFIEFVLVKEPLIYVKAVDATFGSMVVGVKEVVPLGNWVVPTSQPTTVPA